MADQGLAVFALGSGRAYGERVAGHLGVRLAQHEERDFEWGQHKSRPLESVRDRDVYVVQSLHGEPHQSVNDKLCRMLFFLGALRDAGAGRLTAVIPFLCYSRKDRQTKPRDPVTTRYVARLFEVMGVDRVVTLDVHNLAAFQNAFRCETVHLDARRLFAVALAPQLAGRSVTVVSPDAGGIKRAEGYREALEQVHGTPIGRAFLEKRRSHDVVVGGAVVGDVRDRTVLLVDDMISGGTTLALAATACRAAGAGPILAAASHGVFVPDASRTLAEAPIDQIAILDHVPPVVLEPDLVASKLHVVEGAPLIADAIRRLHDGGSIVELLEGV